MGGNKNTKIWRHHSVAVSASLVMNMYVLSVGRSYLARVAPLWEVKNQIEYDIRNGYPFGKVSSSNDMRKIDARSI